MYSSNLVLSYFSFPFGKFNSLFLNLNCVCSSIISVCIFFLPLTLYLNFNLLFTYISISPSSNSLSFHFNHLLVIIKIIIHENIFTFNYTTITFLMIGVIIFTFLRHGELCISLSFVSIITSFTTWKV